MFVCVTLSSFNIYHSKDVEISTCLLFYPSKTNYLGLASSTIMQMLVSYV